MNLAIRLQNYQHLIAKKFDTSGLELTHRDDAAATEDGALSLIPINDVPENKIQEQESWKPGKYETILNGGKSIDGIPSNAHVDIEMGKTDDRYIEGTKNIFLSKIDGKNFIGEAITSGGIIQFSRSKLEIHEGETIVMGREFNDERDASEHFDISDKNAMRVSRKHVAISLINGTYSIKDLDSTNGSFVNITIQRPEEEPLPKVVI